MACWAIDTYKSFGEDYPDVSFQKGKVVANGVLYIVVMEKPTLVAIDFTGYFQRFVDPIGAHAIFQWLDEPTTFHDLENWRFQGLLNEDIGEFKKGTLIRAAIMGQTVDIWKATPEILADPWCRHKPSYFHIEYEKPLLLEDKNKLA